MTAKYKASSVEKKITLVDLNDLEERAKKILNKGTFGYISGGSENEWTLRQNTLAFEHRQIVPRSLTGVDHPTIDTHVFGIDLSTPIMVAPAAAHGLAHVQAEKDTARGAALAGALMSSSTYSTASISEIGAATKGAPKFFQLYLSKNWEFNHYLLDKALSAGVRGIILTTDATVGGYREADVRNRFVFPVPMGNFVQSTKGKSKGSSKGKSISQMFGEAAQKIEPEIIQKIADYTDLPIIVKGIQCGADAAIAIGAGAKGIYVSNHGGRQLNGGPASFDVLEEISETVNKRVPIIFDSGVRHGSHVFKAIACGADLVALGRPFIYGLALGGAKGVLSVFEHLHMEFKIVMQLAGTQTLEDIRNTELLALPYY